jgi:hypothetical protein
MRGHFGFDAQMTENEAIGPVLGRELRTTVSVCGTTLYGPGQAAGVVHERAGQYPYAFMADSAPRS